MTRLRLRSRRPSKSSICKATASSRKPMALDGVADFWPTTRLMLLPIYHKPEPIWQCEHHVVFSRTGGNANGMSARCAQCYDCLDIEDCGGEGLPPRQVVPSRLMWS